ncbi:ataxin 2, partial [Homo sapiens]
QPTPVYTQPVCFAPNMMYPVPVSPGVQPLYPIPMTPMPVNQAKTYRAGKVKYLELELLRYVSTGSLAQQYAHPNATLHPHTPHPQPSATPTGQQQSQHGGSHPAPSPVQHHQHQAAQALHLASPQQQSAIYHAGLAPTPPSMTPASNTQ